MSAAALVEVEHVSKVFAASSPFGRARRVHAVVGRFRRVRHQQRVLREEGVDLGRVVIGHSGDTTDLDYLRRLMDAGSYIGMDRFGLDLMLPFEDRVATVVSLCEQGYAERMVLSHDASCFTHNFEVTAKKELLPNWRFTHLHDEVLPALRARGVTDEQIHTMLVTNPRDVLTPGTGTAAG